MQLQMVDDACMATIYVQLVAYLDMYILAATVDV